MPGTVCKILRCGETLAATAKTAAAVREDAKALNLDGEFVAVLESADAQVRAVLAKIEAARG